MNKNKIAVILNKEELKSIIGGYCLCFNDFLQADTRDPQALMAINNIGDCITKCCYDKKTKYFSFGEVIEENKKVGKYGKGQISFNPLDIKECKRENYPNNYYYYVSDLFASK